MQLEDIVRSGRYCTARRYCAARSLCSQELVQLEELVLSEDIVQPRGWTPERRRTLASNLSIIGPVRMSRTHVYCHNKKVDLKNTETWALLKNRQSGSAHFPPRQHHHKTCRFERPKRQQQKSIFICATGCLRGKLKCRLRR